MKEKWYLISGLCFLVHNFINCLETELPQHFYTTEKKEKVAITKSNPFFFIVVPEDSITKTKTFHELVTFTQSVKIPKHFFGKDQPSIQTEPTVLFFDWQETENSKTRKQAGLDLANGINKLQHRFKTSTLILVGHEQGGNIIHIATNHLTKPVDTVIQLGVPIFPHEKIYAEYLPNPKKIKQLFLFYTDQKFALLHQSLHPKYLHYYPIEVHPDLYTHKLLINNKQPTTDQMLQPKVGKELLEICQLSKEQYKVHHHLIVHLGTIKSETDKVILVADQKVHQSDSMQAFKEKIASKKLQKKLRHNLKRSLAINLNPSEQSRTVLNAIERKAKNNNR
jgi:hypothetical protein